MAHASQTNEKSTPSCWSVRLGFLSSRLNTCIMCFLIINFNHRFCRRLKWSPASVLRRVKSGFASRWVYLLPLWTKWTASCRFQHQPGRVTFTQHDSCSSPLRELVVEMGRMTGYAPAQFPSQGKVLLLHHNRQSDWKVIHPHRDTTVLFVSI